MPLVIPDTPEFASTPGAIRRTSGCGTARVPAASPVGRPPDQEGPVTAGTSHRRTCDLRGAEARIARRSGRRAGHRAAHTELSLRRSRHPSMPMSCAAAPRPDAELSHVRAIPMRTARCLHDDPGYEVPPWRPQRPRRAQSPRLARQDRRTAMPRTAPCRSARHRRRRSRGRTRHRPRLAMPLSATATDVRGNPAAAASRRRSMSIGEGVEVAAVDPDDRGPAVERRVELGAVVHLDQGLELPLPAATRAARRAVPETAPAR